jgi:phosphoglycolate phosphatase
MHLIFDFDGTLIDSFQALLEKFNFLAEQFNYRKIDIQEMNSLRELSSKEFVKHLGIAPEQIPKVIFQLREQLHQEILSLPIFQKIPETLEKLSALKVRLGILTTNSAENVITWLEHHKLRHFFEFIYTEPSYLDKGNTLIEVLETYKIDKTQAFYIGDETRDIDAAQTANIGSIAVTWGFNSAEILAQQNPNYLINYPENLLVLVESLASKQSTENLPL